MVVVAVVVVVVVVGLFVVNSFLRNHTILNYLAGLCQSCYFITIREYMRILREENGHNIRKVSNMEAPIPSSKLLISSNMVSLIPSCVGHSKTICLTSSSSDRSHLHVLHHVDEIAILLLV